MNPTFRQLKIFASVAQHLNYTKAAKALYLSQPAVSMQVKLLEEQTTLPLLEKIGKKLYLTAAGEEIYRYARNTIQQKKDVEEIIEQLNDLQKGHLNIAVASTANHFVIRLLAAFEKLYPKIRISLDVTNRSELLKQLDNNERDLVIMGQPPDNLQLNAIDFLNNPLVVIAAANHPLAQQKTQITLEQLSQEHFIVREEGSGTRKASEKFFKNHLIPFNTTMDISNNRAIKHAVEEGLGLAIVSLHSLEIELRANSLKVLNVEDFPIMRQWYLVENKNKRLSPIAQAFKEFLLQQADKAMGDLINKK
jgi:LysR family transcriptional regulator, low CO2-responsive transcriptional regulator